MAVSTSPKKVNKDITRLLARITLTTVIECTLEEIINGDYDFRDLMDRNREQGSCDITGFELREEK
jgi:hypothetical protein